MTSRSDETGKAGEDERDETSESKKDFRAAAAPPYCLDGEQRRRHGQRREARVPSGGLRERKRHATKKRAIATQTLQQERVYSLSWPSSSDRAPRAPKLHQRLQAGRPHSSLGDQPPLSRVRNVRGQDSWRSTLGVPFGQELGLS